LAVGGWGRATRRHSGAPTSSLGVDDLVDTSTRLGRQFGHDACDWELDLGRPGDAGVRKSDICVLRDPARCVPRGILEVGLANTLGFWDAIHTGAIRRRSRLRSGATQSRPSTFATPIHCPGTGMISSVTSGF
jgi:hypothetical protein